MKTHYRQIWINRNGEIPVDSDGRTFEIHHKDGNRENNEPDNLLCVSIKEHYRIHYEQGDYGACVMIGKRMDLPSNYLSEIQRGKKRPGVGGRKKGTPSEFKGMKRGTPNVSEEGKEKRNTSSKRRFMKTWGDHFDKLVVLYQSKPHIEGSDKVQKNGKQLPYDWAFCKQYYRDFPVTTPNGLQRVIRNIDKHKEWFSV
jgi:hypothetical protein